jgi:hypothetical protein
MLSSKLVGSPDEPAHFCPGCQQMHVLPWKRGDWTFDGDFESPTFAPSFLHTWTEGPEHVPRRCHYVLTAGVLNFCADSTHALAGQPVPLPDLPPDLIWTH